MRRLLMGLVGLILLFGIVSPFWGCSGGGADQVVQKLENDAESGDPVAQYQLGLFYQGGTMVTKDLATGEEWLKRSANQGNTDAMLALGRYYTYLDDSKNKKLVEAYKWYMIARFRGKMEADEHLRTLEKEMFPEEIDLAKQLSSDWKPKGEAGAAAFKVKREKADKVLFSTGLFQVKQGETIGLVIFAVVNIVSIIACYCLSVNLFGAQWGIAGVLAAIFIVGPAIGYVLRWLGI